MHISGKKGFLALITTLFFILNACDESDKPEEGPASGFDKTGMLTHYADNLILPAYTGMQQQLQSLETAVNTFIASPTTDVVFNDGRIGRKSIQEII